MEPLTLKYDIIGEGPTVIFLHGFLEDSTMWLDLLAFLPLRAVLIDLPGHGKSGVLNATNTSLRDIAISINDLIDQLQLTDFSIVGHSLGGYVALEWLRFNPKLKFKKLVLFHSHPWEDTPVKKEERLKVVDLLEKNKSLFIKTAIPNLFLNAKEHVEKVNHLITAAQQLDAFSVGVVTLAMRGRTNYFDVMDTFEEKITIIQGEEDPLINSKKMKFFAFGRKLNIYYLDCTGHMGHIESPNLVLAIFKKELLSEMEKIDGENH